MGTSENGPAQRDRLIAMVAVMKGSVERVGSGAIRGRARRELAMSKHRCASCGFRGGLHHALCGRHLEKLNPKRRKVRLKVTFEVVQEVPADWDDDSVRFFFNESSSCKDNLLSARLRQSQAGGECTCFPYDVELLGPDDGETE